MRSKLAFLLSGSLFAALAACKTPEPPPSASPAASVASAATSVSSAPPAASGARAPDAPPCAAGVACETFPSAAEAVRALVAKGPRVIAFGEAHAQKDGPKVASTTKRFTDGLLPVLKGKATDLVLELWVANGSCGKKTEQKVAAQQKAVAAPQAETNQNEFVTLGNAAKTAGIRPHVLTPPCEDYAKILDAGGGDVDMMLSMIARLTAADIRSFLEKTQGKDTLLVTYGGALHNDVVAKPGHESWTFGPQMVGAIGAKYMEVDLIVPEAIRDTDAWKSMPWYGKLQRENQGNRAVLMTLGPSSYVVFFPPGEPSREPSADAGP
jgi:hypothetical protein